MCVCECVYGIVAAGNMGDYIRTLSVGSSVVPLYSCVSDYVCLVALSIRLYASNARCLYYIKEDHSFPRDQSTYS